jgi:hypothetical protein
VRKARQVLCNQLDDKMANTPNFIDRPQGHKMNVVSRLPWRSATGTAGLQTSGSARFSFALVRDGSKAFVGSDVNRLMQELRNLAITALTSLRANVSLE